MPAISFGILMECVQITFRATDSQQARDRIYTMSPAAENATPVAQNRPLRCVAYLFLGPRRLAYYTIPGLNVCPVSGVCV